MNNKGCPSHPHHPSLGGLQGFCESLRQEPELKTTDILSTPHIDLAFLPSPHVHLLIRTLTSHASRAPLLVPGSQASSGLWLLQQLLKLCLW